MMFSHFFFFLKSPIKVKCVFFDQQQKDKDQPFKSDTVNWPLEKKERFERFSTNANGLENMFTEGWRKAAVPD